MLVADVNDHPLARQLRWAVPVAFRCANSWAVLLGKNDNMNNRVAAMKNSHPTNGRDVVTSSRPAKVFVTALAIALSYMLHGAAADAVPGRLLVKPRDGVNETGLQQLFATHGAQQHSAIQQINVRILDVPEAAQEHVLEALQHNPNIEFAEPDALHQPSLIPNDTYYSFAWHLPKIQAPQAWDITTGSSSVTIAILDTGVESTHPDLAAKIVPLPFTHG